MSDPPNGTSRLVRFGVFELDLRSGDLRKAGARLNLPDQPLQVLTALLERPGELITRDELRRRLWPSDTFVDFEHGLNAAVKRLRDVLGDAADSPRFVETVPKRGYRFVAPVDGDKGLPADDPSPATLPSPLVNRPSHRRLWIATGAVAAVAAMTVAARMFLAATPKAVAPHLPLLTRLTANPANMPITIALISPDGRYLAFGDSNGIHTRLIETGDTQTLPNTKGMTLYGWSGDSTRVRASSCDRATCAGWSISLVGDARYQTDGHWSTGEFVVPLTGTSSLLRIAPSFGVRLDNLDGTPPVMLSHSVGTVASQSVGGRVLFTEFTENQPAAIEAISVKGGGQKATLWRAPAGWTIGDLLELTDHRVVVSVQSSAGTALFELRTNQSGSVAGEPRQLVPWMPGESLLWPSVSADGKRLTFLRSHSQADIYVADLDEGRAVVSTPGRFTFDERADAPNAWTPDSQSIVFDSDRNGDPDIFRQELHRDVPEPLVNGTGDQWYPKVSDGQWLLFLTRTSIAGPVLMRMSLTGGPKEAVYSLTGNSSVHCPPHGRCIIIEARSSAMVVSALDPVAGKGGELAQLPVGTGAVSLLPDGEHLAFVDPAGTGLHNRIRFLSFDRTLQRDTLVNGATQLTSLDSLANGRGFLSVDSGPRNHDLLLVRLDGSSRSLWAPTDVNVLWAIPSPDSKHLAICVWAPQGDAWMMTDF